MKTPLMKAGLVKTTLCNEAGQALILSLLTLTILLGFVGLAADVGTLFYSKRQLQTAADAAALAGASTLTTNTPALSTITTVANNDATLNGVTNGTNGFTVSVTWPYTPQSMCSNCVANNFVEVTVSQTQKTFFQSLFTGNPVTVAARAVAFAQNSPGCMFTLDQNGSDPNGGGIFLNGLGLFVNAPTCAMYIDSNSSNNGLSVGSSFLASVTAKSIGIVGNPGYSSGFFTSINPKPVGGIVPVADPLAYLTPPATGACLPSHVAVTCASNTCTSASGAALGATLSPGNYCASATGAPAILVKTTGITFSPGTYIINGETFAAGGLTINAVSANAAATGTGVTFYFYNGATFNISGPGSIFSANGVTLTAPGPTSPYAGILFYQDRADNSTGTLGGYFGKLDLEGAIYIPDGTLSFPAVISATTLQNNTILVAKSIQFVGILGLFTDYDKATGSGGISPIKTVVLTE